jgi:hypothetical protein
MHIEHFHVIPMQTILRWNIKLQTAKAIVYNLSEEYDRGLQEHLHVQSVWNIRQVKRMDKLQICVQLVEIEALIFEPFMVII